MAGALPWLRPTIQSTTLHCLITPIRQRGRPCAECLGGGADALICLGALFSAHRISLQKNILAGLAARYRIPSIFVNHVGAVDGNVFPRASAAFDHTGAPLAAAELFSEETVMLDLAAEKGQLLWQ